MTVESYRIALAGNPNTGKSTLFNLLTGLRQHTGNWPGKTVLRAEGSFTYRSRNFQVIDLPGTYSLYSNSADEETARDYIIFEKPDVTVVVLDATALERNLNLALQVMEMTDRVIVCVNLIDEAKRKGIVVDDRKMAARLGVPVVKISARNQEGVDALLDTVFRMVTGEMKARPVQVRYSAATENKISRLVPRIQSLIGPDVPARWIALRMLDGDRSLLDSLKAHWMSRGKGDGEVEHDISRSV
ncbi:FeoB small GTPase domain-containing protein [Paludifilum halophilum]|uniref:Iron transporter FeoB n=1 Tax=Paludifilum halophilum TaxID=1642702 RepID=A0A235B5L2_9BACL|nr:FeoB small GTPase domain-containing protein [Paludifilum halophilum]OYD07259.1 iron transporter FeoB [Paludifilum halophilum]